MRQPSRRTLYDLIRSIEKLVKAKARHELVSTDPDTGHLTAEAKAEQERYRVLIGERRQALLEYGTYE